MPISRVQNTDHCSSGSRAGAAPDHNFETASQSTLRSSVSVHSFRKSGPAGCRRCASGNSFTSTRSKCFLSIRPPTAITALFFVNRALAELSNSIVLLRLIDCCARQPRPARRPNSFFLQRDDQRHQKEAKIGDGNGEGVLLPYGRGPGRRATARPMILQIHRSDQLEQRMGGPFRVFRKSAELTREERAGEARMFGRSPKCHRNL